MRRSLLFLVAVLTLAPSLRADDLAVVRQNFLDFYTAAVGDSRSPRMQEGLAALEWEAKQYSAPGYLLSDGGWTDIDYGDTPAGDWSPWAHVRRTATMARAYRMPGTSVYGDPALRDAIVRALDKTRAFYSATTLPLGNWWFWTIGVPLDLGPTLVLMQGEVPQKINDDLVLSLAVHIGASPTSKGVVGPTPVGENLVWSSFDHLCLALLRNEPARLAQVRDAMTTVTAVSATAEGIKPDSSFHQHGAQLYTGGYGGSFANDVSRYLLFTRGTAYTLPAASMKSFADYLVDGIAWSLYGNYFDVSVIGREVVRTSTSGYNGLAALLQASQIAALPRGGEIRAATNRMLLSWTWTMPAELAALATPKLASSAAAAWPSGHRHYFNSDYTIHRRDGWFASVKMFSTRTKSGERTNGENLFGSRQSDGRFSLSLDGDEYFGNATWAVTDWSRLSGITVEQRPDAADDTYGFGTRAFAGGTGDASNGVSAMELAPLGSTLTARKSWFFFDDAIVFLTNGIASPSPYRVETIVNQWPLSNASARVTSSGGSSPQWIFADRVGYVFPTAGQEVRVANETRTGNWAALGGSSDTTPVSAPMLTVWIDHGTTPVAATAEYMIVPNTTEQALRDFTARQPIRILANTANVSAARDLRTNATGIVFWTAGSSFDGISSDSQAIVYLVDKGPVYELSVSDPNNGTGSMRITLPGRLSAAGVNVAAGLRSSVVTIPKNGGKTTAVTLTKLTGRVPVVRRR